ncbi:MULTISPECIES: MurR/RpiR family transcriptional regulator [unclassified Sedimentibacter]|uniref:MurR/RpiR family transcriptional regulator n=1 Tax=unclassified Sedimentibacter TaxID=2649220 RepID=UPI0027E1AF7A|nr:MurR/RpiR family transcriptional regulator [Sedimentibacter sp. MB35-C1]WMJ78060.1 MurR/RpiR family transcriptional regulator [Sedimentibacter sp. MB35-C1]
MNYEEEKKLVKNALPKVIHTEKTGSQIIEYILDKYLEIPYINFAQFMKDQNLSEDDANKFLTSNGYKDFSQFQHKFSELIISLIPRIESVSCLSSTLTKSDIKNIFTSVADAEAYNMRNLLDSIEIDKFSSLIHDILNSPEVIIIGTRSSITLAQYASYMLNKIGVNVKKITSADTSSFDNIQNFDRSSLVIAFGFKRYPKETIKLLNYFSRKNFKIISITDNSSSPLCNFSSYSIYIQAYSLAYTDSFVNGMVLINALALAIGKMDNKKVVKRLNDFEETARSLEYYF